MPPTQKMKKIEKCQNENLQKLIILEGFSQNGHHHLFQRIFLRIIAPVKIDFHFFFEHDILLTLES